MIKNKVWQSQEGPKRLGDMETSHLRNCLRLYTKRFDEWWMQNCKYCALDYDTMYDKKMPEILKFMEQELEYRGD